MSHRQMDCFVGLRPPRNDEGRCNDVFVVSAGEVYPGLSTEVNVGGDILHFVEGILVKVDEG